MAIGRQERGERRAEPWRRGAHVAGRGGRFERVTSSNSGQSGCAEHGFHPGQKMRGVGQGKPVIDGAAAAAGNSTPFHNICRDCDRKVRFEDRGRSVRTAATPKHQLLDNVPEKPRPSRPPDGVLMIDRKTGELPPFGEHRALQKVQKDFGNVDQNQEIHLRGKLKWLFEQDRMFWESNSAKSSRRGSPECDRSRSLNSLSATAKPAVVDSPNDAKLVHVVEESFKRVCSSRKPPVNKLKPPRQPQQTTEEAVVSRGQDLSTNRHPSPAKVPWTFSTSSVKFWPRGKAKAQNSTNAPNTESKANVPAAWHSSVDDAKRTKANEDPTLPHSSLEEILTDYEDAPKSGESSEMATSDEDEEMRKKVDVIVAEAGDRSLADVRNQAAYLKAKCGMLAKEKDHALRKWKRSCQEIDDAANMAQALRSAIETLLEASATDSRADFKARQGILEDQTQALQLRMENLRRKNSEGPQRLPKVKNPISPLEGRVETLKKTSEGRSPPLEDRVETLKKTSEGRSPPLEDRVETLKKTSEGRSLASPDRPRDTEYKVEALRARLEKLMLATNSRISDETRQPLRSAREEKKKPVEDWLHQKSHGRDEKSELKMKGWLDSLSAELTSDESPATSSAGVCEKCNGAGGFICGEIHPSGTPSGFTSKQATPSTSKQESPWSSIHDRERECPGSAISSEETKKNVIHKIAEEVRMETEQWFQVQELLGRVGEDMKGLQEACSTWERRAILAEAQVVNMQQEGPDNREKTLHVGDEKVAELQNEMLRLTETMEEVKKQIGGIKIDPSGWFEAAHRFGYAFMPVNLHSPDASSASTDNYRNLSSGNVTLDSSEQRQGSSGAAAGLSQPIASGLTAFSSISSSEITHAENEVRQRSQIPSQQWAKEIARAEEDEILTAENGSGPEFKLEFPSSTIKEMSSASDGKLLGKTAKLFQEELGLESSNSGGDMLLQTQASIRERCTTLLQQEEQVSRCSNLSASWRSPLKDVLDNITSCKENKRPN